MKTKVVSSTSNSVPMASTKLGKAGDSIPSHSGNSTYCPKISRIG